MVEHWIRERGEVLGELGGEKEGDSKVELYVLWREQINKILKKKCHRFM